MSVGFFGFIIVVIGLLVTPPNRRSMLAVGLVGLGFIIMAHAGWRPFQ